MEAGKLTAAVNAALSIAKLPEGTTVNIKVGDANELRLEEGTDNAPVIKAAFDAVPFGEPAEILIPKGKYYSSFSPEWHHKIISLKGKGVGISTLIIDGKRPGIKVTRENSIPRSKISGLSLITHNSLPGLHGIELLAITDLQDIYIKGFGGHGVRYYGNLSYMKSDVSGSVALNVEAAECGGDGMRMEGGDANAILSLGCNFRDNTGVGWCDMSFLGCKADLVMGHNNKMGDFYAGNTEGTDGNNNQRTMLDGCYSEGGNTALSRLSVYTSVLGGTWGTRYQIFGNNGLPKNGTYLPLEGDQFYNDANSFYNPMRYNPKPPNQ